MAYKIHLHRIKEAINSHIFMYYMSLLYFRKGVSMFY